MGKEKKEIGKLLELLNEYDPYIASDGEHKPNLWGYAYQGHSAVFPKELAESYIVSARYGFVKWLVENDKIDLGEKLFNLTKNDNRKSIICDLDNNDFSWEDTFLMLLAISDTPIEDLCGYLKDDATEKVDTLLKGIKKSCESLGI